MASFLNPLFIQNYLQVSGSGSSFLRLSSGAVGADISWSPTQNRSITLPNASGTLALQEWVSAGFQPLNSGLTSIAALSTTVLGRSLLTSAAAVDIRTAAGFSNQPNNSVLFSNGTTYTSNNNLWFSNGLGLTVEGGNKFRAISDTSTSQIDLQQFASSGSGVVTSIDIVRGTARGLNLPGVNGNGIQLAFRCATDNVFAGTASTRAVANFQAVMSDVTHATWRGGFNLQVVDSVSSKNAITAQGTGTGVSGQLIGDWSISGVPIRPQLDLGIFSTTTPYREVVRDVNGRITSLTIYTNSSKTTILKQLTPTYSSERIQSISATANGQSKTLTAAYTGDLLTSITGS